MRPLAAALVLVLILSTAALLVATGPSQGYSDGYAGGSGAVPEHLKKCAPGVEYCRVTMPGCGDCHGNRDAMLAQRGTEPPVVDRIQLLIKIDGNAEFREYEPGSSHVVELAIHTDRPRGQFNSGGFNLNVTGGRLESMPLDDTVRITGGIYNHLGSKNASYTVNNQRLGAVQEDERSWAGEATHTAKGAEQRNWRLKWTAPGKVEPHGVAFQASFAVPNGNGWDDTCVYNANSEGACDATLGYSDQNRWDWWYFGVPLRILCEKGQAYETCQRNVVASIRPPAPPRDTCPPEQSPCITATEENGEDTPAPPAVAALLVLALGLWATRRRRL